MASVLQKDPVIYERERDSFIRDLKHFHETRGGRFRRLPHINGKDVDLYLLYVLVTGKGGWVKVNQRNDWMSILEYFPTFKICVNGEVAIKQVYSRYLDKYERVNFLGETADRVSEDDEDGRHKRWTTSKTSHFTTVSYSSLQHNLASENAKASLIAITSNTTQQQCIPSTDYDKLSMSLISPLPNEQDFAINVCALLCGGTTDNDADVSDISASESKFGADFKLYEHPRLVNYLLAHAAVFDHPALRMLMEECYKEVRGHSMKYFWSDVLVDQELSVLMDEKKFVKQRLKREKLKRRLKAHVHRTRTTYGVSSSSDESDQNDDSVQSSSSSSSSSRFIDERIHLKIEPEDAELFCLNRSIGAEDWFGQRVLQIATILRNATFMDENVPTLSSNSTFLRFVLLCCGSRWNCIHQLGFDMLTNIAHEVTLDDTLIEHVLRIIGRGLESQDRAVILACIETLNKFGQKEENEDIILRSIDQNVYERICTFLTLKDIMLLIQTLECLYSLTSLGERSCNAIAHVRGVVHTLVSLVTVEAQSYGPSACILMRVVETMMSNDNEEPESVPAGMNCANMPPLVSVTAQTGSVFSNQSNTITITTATPVNSAIGSASSMPNTHIVNINTPITNGITTTLTSIPNSSQSMITSSSSSCIPNNSLGGSSIIGGGGHSSSIIPSTPSSAITAFTTSSSSTTITVSSSAVPNKLSIPCQKVNIPPLVSISTPVSSCAVSTVATMSSVSNCLSSNSIATGVLSQQENENFAKCWLRALFEFHPNPGRGIEQNEIYKQYLNVCTRSGRKGVIAPTHFPHCVRAVFGSNVGPRQVVGSKVGHENSVSKIYVYEGLQVRKNPQPFTITTNSNPVQSSMHNNPSSPILKAQLSSPAASNIIAVKKEPKSKVSSSHPHLSNVLLGTGNVNSSSISSGCSVMNKNMKVISSSPSSSVSMATSSCSSPSVITSLAASSTALNISKNSSLVINSLSSPSTISSCATSSSTSAQQDSYIMISGDAITNSGVSTANSISSSSSNNNNNNTSLIKSLLASKVGDILGTNSSSSNLLRNDNCLITSVQPSHHQVVIAKSAAFSPAQVTQRQQHQQQNTPILQQQQLPNSLQTIAITPSQQSQLQQLIQQPVVSSSLQLQPQTTLQISSPKHQNEQDANKLLMQQHQPQQIIQVIHHSSQQQQQSQQQSQLSANFRNSQPVIVQHQSPLPIKNLSAINVISSSDADKLIPHMSQQQQLITTTAIQKKPESSPKQHMTLTEQIRQLLQNQKSTSQLSQLIAQPVTSKSSGQIQQQQQQTIQNVQSLKQNQNLQQVQVVQQVKQAGQPQQQSMQHFSTTTRQSESSGQQAQPQQQQQQQQTEQSKTVSVITSSAAVQAGCALKPFLSRINGLRNLHNMNIIIADRTEDNEIRIIANSKLSSLSASGAGTTDDDGKKALLANNIVKLPVSTASVGTIIDNNLLSDNIILPTSSGKSSMETTDICEPSGSQTLQMINLRDSDNNIVGTDGNPSSVAFNDYLINGLSGGMKADVISESMLNNPLPNNMLTEESLLNTIMMEDALASNLIGDDPMLNNIHVDNMDFSLSTGNNTAAAAATGTTIKLETNNNLNNNNLNNNMVMDASSGTATGSVMETDNKSDVKPTFVLVNNNTNNNNLSSMKNTLMTDRKSSMTDANFTTMNIKTENADDSNSSSTTTNNNSIAAVSSTTAVKNVATAGKSLMLAELLEKVADRKDPPILNGALRIGEKGLELMTFTNTTTANAAGSTTTVFIKDMGKPPPVQEKSVICSGKRVTTTQTYSRFNRGKAVEVIRKTGNNCRRQTQFGNNVNNVNNNNTGNSSGEKVIIGVKRTSDQEVQCDEMPKKPHLNGDSNLSSSNDDDTMDESNVKASSSAANLYAALAADVLGDIDGIDDEESSAVTESSQQTNSQQAQSSLSVQTQLSVPTTTLQPQQQLRSLQTQQPIQQQQQHHQQQAQQIQQSLQSPQQIQLQQTTQQQHSPIHQQQQAMLVEPTQQLYLSTGGPGNPSRQILALTPSSAFSALAGQPLIVSPQTAIIQGQPQTVLVTQTSQHHGGAPTKTIIILSPNTPPLSLPSTSAGGQQQKVIVRRTATPPLLATSSSTPQTAFSTASSISSSSSSSLLTTNATKQTFQSKGTVTTGSIASIPFCRMLTQATTNSVVMSQQSGQQFIQTMASIPQQIVGNSPTVGVIAHIGSQSQISSGLMVPFSSSQMMITNNSSSVATNTGGSIIVSTANANVSTYPQQQNTLIATQNAVIMPQTCNNNQKNTSSSVIAQQHNSSDVVTQQQATTIQTATVISAPHNSNVITLNVNHNPTATVIQSTNVARNALGQCASSASNNNNNNINNNNNSNSSSSSSNNNNNNATCSSGAGDTNRMEQSRVVIQTTRSSSPASVHTSSSAFSTTICQTVTTNTITITKHAGNATSSSSSSFSCSSTSSGPTSTTPNPSQTSSRQVKVIKNAPSHTSRSSIHRILSDSHGQFLCEWRSCMRSFKTANEVYLHACSSHCPSGSQEIQCLWERCDAMKRKRFSLMTHLYDRHCNPEILRVMSLRRRQISQSGRSDIPPPSPPPMHPGYAPNAAYQAIRRHALEFVSPRELQDENEGPVTKSIRLTSSLILRNLVIYSTTGRRYVSGYEPQLASVALSNVESSRTISQLLYDLNNHDR